MSGMSPASLRYPNIGVTDGGSVDGMIAAGQQVMKIANAQTKIIPGHLGPVVGFSEIQQQLVMFAAVRSRVAAAIRGEGEDGRSRWWRPSRPRISIQAGLGGDHHALIAL